MTDVEEPETLPEPEDEQPAEGQNVNAATRSGARKQREKQRKQEDLVDDFWRAVLQDPIGRAELWRILSSGGAFKAPFAVGPNGFPQPEATWFKAGQQALVLGEYHRLLRIDFQGVHLMLTENDPAFRKTK